MFGGGLVGFLSLFTANLFVNVVKNCRVNEVYVYSSLRVFACVCQHVCVSQHVCAYEQFDIECHPFIVVRWIGVS